MANDTTKFDPNEEEYHSSDTETPSVFAASATNASPGKSSVFERLKRKNILIALGVIIVIFVVYKIIDVAFTPSTSRTRISAPAQQMVMTPISNAPTAQVSQQPIAAAPVDNRLNALEQQGNNNQAGIDKLNTEMADVQNTLAAMNAKLTDLTTAMQAVTAQYAEQQERLKMQEAAKHAKVSRRHWAVRPIYYVRALVPGRAWLSTKNGGTVTVGLGGNLPGYGIVQVIDTNQGTVTTSTGAIIGYNPGDR